MHRYLVRRYTSYTRSQVQRAYHELGILGKARVRKVRTTNSASTERRFVNRIKDLAIVRPNQVWVGDVTYIRVGTAGAFLALLMDAFSRMILGWSLSLSNDTSLAKEALEMALKTGSPEIHHTDQGSPYGSAAYTKRLHSLGIRSSMSQPGKPEDNGRAERLNRTIKEEEVYRNEYRTVAEAKHAIELFISKYNHHRLHQALNYRTPSEVHRPKGDTP
jgi:transposase InsO family protein